MCTCICNYMYMYMYMYIYIYICIFKGLRPPAAGPLSWILEHRWLVTGGWGLLAGDCWLATTSSPFLVY